MKISLIALLACCAVSSTAFAFQDDPGANVPRLTDDPGANVPRLMDDPGANVPRLMDDPGANVPRLSRSAHK